MKRLFAILLAVAMLFSLTACGDSSYTTDIFAMDTVMKLTANGANAQAGVEAAVREINLLESQLSNTIASSEISQLNAGGSGTVSEETAQLLTAALTYAQKTDGAFDMRIVKTPYNWKGMECTTAF